MRIALLALTFSIGCGGGGTSVGSSTGDGSSGSSKDGSSGSSSDGGAGPSCSACGYGTRCDPSTKTCVPADTMSISLGNLVLEKSDGSVTSATVYQDQVCGVRAMTTPYVATPPDATDGPCSVTTTQLGGPSTYVPPVAWQPDAGAITVSGSSRGSIAYFTRNATNGCLTGNLDPGAATAFVDSDVLAFAASGGLDIPAFSKVVPATPALALSPVSLAVGAPAAVTWTGSDAGNKLSLTLESFDSTTAVVIECYVDDTGSFTIPSSMTSQLLASPQSVNLSADREHSAHLEPEGTPAVVELVVLSSASITLAP